MMKKLLCFLVILFWKAFESIPKTLFFIPSFLRFIGAPADAEYFNMYTEWVKPWIKETWAGWWKEAEVMAAGWEKTEDTNPQTTGRSSVESDALLTAPVPTEESPLKAGY